MGLLPYDSDLMLAWARSAGGAGSLSFRRISARRSTNRRPSTPSIDRNLHHRLAAITGRPSLARPASDSLRRGCPLFSSTLTAMRLLLPDWSIYCADGTDSTQFLRCLAKRELR